jgi:HK97 family phage major capsid protein
MGVPDTNYAKETKEAFNELKEAVKNKNEEVETLKNTVSSTKERLEKAQSRLDELETKTNRRDLDTDHGSDTAEMSDERKAFKSWVNGANVSGEAYREHLYPGESKGETKDLSIGSGAGNQSDALAPVEFVEEIIDDVVDISPIRQVARTLQTERKQVEIPKLQARPNAAFVSEGGTRSDDTGLDFGADNGDMLVINTHEFFVEVPVTRQMIEDAVFDVEAELRDYVSTEMDRLLGEKHLRGTGTGEPQGMITDADFQTVTTADTTTDSIDAVSAEELRNLPLRLKQEYRNNGVWGVTREGLRHARTLEDPSGDFIFEPSLDASTPATIDGFEYVEMQDLVASATAGQGDIPYVFGDYQQAYYVVDRLQMEVIRDPYTAKSSGRIEYHFRGRVGGDLALAEAVKGIEIA